MPRLRVDKTLKMLVGGKFVRSESGRTMPVDSASPHGTKRTVNAPLASRKDLRDAVRVARAAQAGWAAATAYNRGQVLYRLAEMLDDRLETLVVPEADATAAVDRVIHHAGWTDKISALLSTLNPVAATYVNYSKIRPIGVVCAAPDANDGLLGLVEAICAPLVMANAAIVLVPTKLAEVAVALSEAVAVSDLPGGVVNVLTGDQDELLRLAAAHDDVDALYLAGAAGSKVRAELDTEGARVMRRLIQVPGAGSPATPHELGRLSEVQTVWMSAYEPRGGAAGY